MISVQNIKMCECLRRNSIKMHKLLSNILCSYNISCVYITTISKLQYFHYQYIILNELHKHYNTYVLFIILTLPNNLEVLIGQDMIFLLICLCLKIFLLNRQLIVFNLNLHIVCVLWNCKPFILIARLNPTNELFIRRAIITT